MELAKEHEFHMIEIWMEMIVAPVEADLISHIRKYI